MFEGLLVIDMQDCFYDSAGQPELIEHVVDRINFYKEHNLPIIVVSYGSHEDLIPEISDAVGDAGHLYMIVKHWDDGSEEIAEQAMEQLPDTEIWEATGVNFQYCVGKTCCSLANIFPEKVFNVNLSACRSQYTLKSSLEDFRVLQNDYSDYGNLLIIGDGHDISAWNGSNHGDSGGL